MDVGLRRPPKERRRGVSDDRDEAHLIFRIIHGAPWAVSVCLITSLSVDQSKDATVKSECIIQNAIC